MVLEKLSSSLRSTLQKIAQAMFVDDKLLNELMKDIQRALLQADVNVKLVLDLTNKIKTRFKDSKLPSGLTAKEHLINIVYEELTVFLGGEAKKIEITKKPFTIMLVGLFGSGKTTTAGKLAKYYMNRGMKVALVGLDVYRPAAMDQLEQVGKAINAQVFVERGNKDVITIYDHFKSKLDKFDIIILDTAGRDALSEDLIAEVKKLTAHVQPQERLLVISADIGQTAQTQAQAFHDSCNISGVIATKMDGTAKAGGALSACAITQAPIVFIGVGEKVDDLESFNPKGFVGRLLGMGDLESLLEKAKTVYSEEAAEDLGKRFLKGDFTLIDLYEQMAAMQKMGSLSKLVDMIPGFSNVKMPKELLEVQEGKLEKWKHAMQSMTQAELEDPELLDASRIDRVAKGSGVDVRDVRELLKQYRQAKKMAKMLKGSPQDLQKVMKKFQGKMPGR